MRKKHSKLADAVAHEILRILKLNIRQKAAKSKKSRKRPVGDSQILRRTYQLKSWKGWDHQIHFSILDFRNTFEIYPNILQANPVTFSRMDVAANSIDKDKIRGPQGQAAGKYQFISISGFCSDNYDLRFCIDRKLPNQSYVLFYDADPDGDGGEPIPEEDTPDILLTDPLHIVEEKGSGRRVKQT